MPGYLKMKTEITTWTAVTPTVWIPEKKNVFMKIIQYILGFFRKSPELHTHFYHDGKKDFWIQPRCECWATLYIEWRNQIIMERQIAERNKKLQFLHKCMMQYENKTGENLTKLRQDVLYRNNINSRSELTDVQLDQEIKFFTSI